MKSLAGLLALLAMLAPAQSRAADLEVDGTTLFRIEQRSAPGFNKQSILPATQYLGMDVSRIGGKDLSFHFYGWGRLDLADKSGESTTARSTDGNFTYGYLLYRFPKANAQLKAGRFFVYEGVAAEQVDGVYARTDLNKGFTIAAFGGIPVKLDRANSTKGDAIGGGRLGYRYGGIFDIGLSGLQETNSPTPWGKSNRQLAGLDLWLSPVRMIELSGRSSYNGSTSELAEHSYSLNLKPVAGLTAAVNYADIRLKDYYTFTNLPSLFNPNNNENYRSYGANATYRLTQLSFPTEITIDYRHYKRDQGNSDRFGGEIRITPIAKLSTGVSFARTTAAAGIMSYYEARAFGMYTTGRYSANIDMIANVYDQNVYGKKNAYEITGGCGYQATPSLRVSGEASYADNPWYDGDVRGVLRLTYAYNNKKGAAQ